MSNTNARVNISDSSQIAQVKDYNLCNLSEQDRRIADIDNQVCRWLFLNRNGKIGRPDIQRVLQQLAVADRDLYRERLNIYAPRFKGESSVQKNARPEVWQKMVNNFKKEIAQLGQ